VIRLVLGAARELLGRWGAWAALAWLLLAAGLAADATLGSGSLGEYLGLVALLPAAFLFRAAGMSERRAREGWRVEACLRDPAGWRLPLAEFLATAGVIAAGLALAWLPSLAPGLRPAEEQGISASVLVVRSRPDEWRVQLPRPCPAGAEVELLLEWSAPPEGEPRLSSDRGRNIPAPAGQLLRWPLDAEEAAAGELVLLPVRGARLASEWTRLLAARPGLAALPGLLAAQLLFWLPLAAFALLLARRGVRGSLAGLGALGLGTLAAWTPPAALELGASPFAWGARGLAAVARLLPEVGGLVAAGPDFHLRAAGVTLLPTLAWLGLGALALAATRRRTP
jgi:hypothetical protein